MKRTPSTPTSFRVLQDGSRDAKILLALWFLRRTFWPLFLLGLIGGLLAIDVSNADGAASSARATVSRLLSPLVGSAAAIFLKLTVSYLAMIASYPIQAEHRRALGQKKYGYFFSRFLDTWQVLKGLSSLRWTHHVRQEAASRIDIKIIRSGMLDKIFDVLTIMLVILFVVTLFAVVFG
jgi:hypothetical protein